MSYLEFRKALLPFKVFSVNDIRKIFPGFDSKRLNEWQHKGYVQKLINKWWMFTETPVNELLLYRVSNLLLQPSYVSLESALSYYHFIPEGVYSMQAISTVKTISYTTPAGNFNYHSVKPAYFFGYAVVYADWLPVRIAQPEKAILDYLYLNSKLNRLEDFAALRFNTSAINETINWEKLDLYLKVFDSNTLSKRTRLFKKMQLHAALK